MGYLRHDGRIELFRLLVTDEKLFPPLKDTKSDVVDLAIRYAWCPVCGANPGERCDSLLHNNTHHCRVRIIELRRDFS